NSNEDLLQHTLLQHTNTRGAGSSWLQLFKKMAIDSHTDFRQISFDDSNLVIQAAEHGHGVAFERHSFVADKINGQSLERPLNIGLHSEYQYYLITDPDHVESAPVKNVLTWLNKESKEFILGNQSALRQINWL
ncbi:MAG: hypothetical protein K2P84_04030, partial [Undibacterium sp.]|nr:hypothetical protein [Undibacterium sp.]